MLGLWVGGGWILSTKSVDLASIVFPGGARKLHKCRESEGVGSSNRWEDISKVEKWNIIFADT